MKILSICFCFIIFTAIHPFAQANEDVFQDLTIDQETCENCPLMVRLPTGKTILGALPGVGHSDEKNARGEPLIISIDQSFAVSVGEVTVSQFAAFLDDNPQYQLAPACAGLFEGKFTKKIGANWKEPGFVQKQHHPVVCVRWQDAQAYAEWLSRKTGKTYRLLSEAEWEYAARAGSPYKYWWGEGLVAEVANCDGDCADSFLQTAPAFSLEPNPFGLYHMSGNVWEWTQDCYKSDAYQTDPEIYPNAMGGEQTCQRVIRGGSWADGAWALRNSNREAWRSDMPLNDVGFRVAREGDDQPT